MTSLDQTRQRLEYWQQRGRYLDIFDKMYGTFLGYVVVNPDKDQWREDTRELGFALLTQFRRQGYMKQAVQAVCAALKQEGIRYVWACCFAENTASAALIRSLGFTRMGRGTFDALNDHTFDTLEFRKDLTGEEK